MEPDYIKIQLSHEKNRNWVLNVSPKFIKEKLFYRPDNMKLTLETTGDFTGVLVILPVEAERIRDLTMELLEGYLRRLQREMNIEYGAVCVDEAILNHFHIQQINRGKDYMLFIIRELTERIRVQAGLRKKTARILLIDDGSWRFFYALRQLYPEKNYFYVWSERLDTLEKTFDDIYMDTGLLIRGFTYPPNQKLEADIVIDLRERKENIDSYLEGEPKIFSFGGTSTVLLKSMTMPIELELFAQIVYAKEWLFSRFAAGSLNPSEEPVLMENLRNTYTVVLDKVCCERGKEK